MYISHYIYNKAFGQFIRIDEIRSTVLSFFCLFFSKSRLFRFSADISSYLFLYSKRNKVVFYRTKKPELFRSGYRGGRYKTRTCDLPHVKRMRYQLRQSSVFIWQDVFYIMRYSLSRIFSFGKRNDVASFLFYDIIQKLPEMRM